MERFNSRTLKFVGLIFLVCFVFAIAVRHAYDYLPKDIQVENTSQQVETKEDILEYNNPDADKNISTEEEDSESEDIAENDVEIEEDDSDNMWKKENRFKKLVVAPELEPLESINEKTTSKNSVDEDVKTFESYYKKGKNLKRNRDLEKAIVEFQSALSLANTDSDKATCYEQISECYAILKRYGSAIVNAQRAYNLVKTTSREVLLARLYYKTGDIEKATNRINFVLKKDFLVED